MIPLHDPWALVDLAQKGGWRLARVDGTDENNMTLVFEKP